MKVAALTITITFIFLSAPLVAIAQEQSPYSPENMAKYLDEYKKNYPGPITFSYMPDATLVIPSTTYENQVLLYPNQDRPTVQQTHAQSMQGTLMSNQSMATNRPNQEQPSNEDILRNRMNAVGQR